MNKTIKAIFSVLAVIFMLAIICVPAFAVDASEDGMVVMSNTEVSQEAEAEKADDSVSIKAIAAAVIIGVVASVGAIAMTIAIKSSADNMARQPEASGSIRSAMMLGLVFIETAIIYALIVAILVVFVL